jgi:hyperosmotically inducible periplasmic protein
MRLSVSFGSFFRSFFRPLGAAAAMAVACSASAQSSAAQVGVGTGSPAATTPAGAANSASDSHPSARSPTVRQVRAAISRTPGIDMSSMAVFVHGGRVTLVGSAHTQDQIDLAQAAAENVTGVVSVDNRLFVKPER